MLVRLPDRRRAASFALALIVELLILLALLLWGPRVVPRPAPERLPTTFSLVPANEDRAATAPEHRSTAKASAQSAAATPPPPVVPLVKPAQPVPPNTLAGVMPLSLDIGKLHGTAAAKGDGDGPDSKLAYGPGEGPGGAALYNAEWYREPSNAELNGFLTKPPPNGGWALIACRTIPNYHVENCQSIGESPMGSGLARAMRQAAWQFLVRPPRSGGKSLIGAWVKIRIDFHTTVVKRPAGPKMPDDESSSEDQQQ